MKCNRRKLIVGILLFTMWLSAGSNRGLAQDKETRPWSELLIVVGHKVALSLPNGAYIQGEALAVEPDNLRMDVKKTSNPNLYPQGEATIPRSLVSVIEVWTRQPKDAPIATAVIGTATSLGGAFGISVFGGPGGYGGLLASTGIRLGGAILGAIVGQRLDHREVSKLIRIASEPGSLTDHVSTPSQPTWTTRTIETVDLQDLKFPLMPRSKRANWAF